MSEIFFYINFIVNFNIILTMINKIYVYLPRVKF